MAGGNMLGGIRLPQQQTGANPYGWAPGAQQNFSGTQSNPQLYGGPWNQLTQMMAGPQFHTNPYQQPYGTAGNMTGQTPQAAPQMTPQAQALSFYGAGMPYFANPYGGMPPRGLSR